METSSYRTTAKVSETSVKIICGRCVKEARVVWEDRWQDGLNHFVHVECHGMHMLVNIDEHQVFVQKAKVVDGVVDLEKPTRITLLLENLRECETSWLKELRVSAADCLTMLRERIEHIDVVLASRANEEVQELQPRTRFTEILKEES